MNEAELVLTDLLKCDRLALYLNKDKHLDKSQGEVFTNIFKRRISREPLQYILGKADFMGLVFKVNKDVLIPRPETEILVEAAVKYAQRMSYVGYRILDLGTGSGCIAVTLAKLLPDVEITAIDISQEALEIAKHNAELNKVSGKIKFIHSDLFSTYDIQHTTCDMIISNPPYIPSDEISKLQSEVQSEPRLALDGGEDGLDFYRRLTKEPPAYLKTGGFLIMEMGFNQVTDIKNIFQKTEIFEIIEIIKDYNNIERVLIVRKTVKNPGDGSIFPSPNLIEK